MQIIIIIFLINNCKRTKVSHKSFRDIIRERVRNKENDVFLFFYFFKQIWLKNEKLITIKFLGLI